MPSDPHESPQRNCDTNIVANSDTSCPFAENTFYEYYRSGGGGTSATSLMVHSPTTQKDYEVFCKHSETLIACTGSPLSTGIYVSFPRAAIAAYTEAEANAYASSRDVGHPGAPGEGIQSQAPEQSEPSESEGNESATEDEVGSYSHAGDEAFCNAHECIGEFEGEGGYVVECSDGSYSHAGGISGACSGHGGIGRR